MKKFLALLALLLLLTACGVPAAETTPEPDALPLPSFSQPSGVYADWTKLQAPQVPENVGTRLAEGPLTELVPSENYGRLLPYVGDELRADVGGMKQYRYGLVTENGCVVLDPVLDIAWTMPVGDGYALVLGKQREADGLELVYALCAPDGSWCTDFLYSSIYTNPDGEICLMDVRYDSNGQYIGNMDNACVMDSDGSVLLNLSQFEPEIDLGDFRNSPDIQYAMANMSEGYAQVSLADGRTVFMDKKGRLLHSDEFDGYFAGAYSFSGGIACVRKEWNGLWGAIDRSGKWVIPPEYADLTQYDDAVIAATADGRKLLLNTKGEQLSDLSGLDSPLVQPLRHGFLITDWGDGSLRGYDLQLNDLGLKEYNAVYDDVAVFKTVRDGREGFVVYDGQNQVFHDGSYTQLEMYNGYITAVTSEGEGRIMDLSGTVLARLPNCLYGVVCVRDCVTGEPYLVKWNEIGAVLTDTTGRTAVCPSGLQGSIINGFFNVVDETGAGIKNLDGETIFRKQIDFTD